MSLLKIEKQKGDCFKLVYASSRNHNKTLIASLCFALFLHAAAYIVFPIATFKIKRYPSIVLSETQTDSALVHAERHQELPMTFIAPPGIERTISNNTFDFSKRSSPLMTWNNNPFWKEDGKAILQWTLFDHNAQKQSAEANLELLEKISLDDPIEIALLIDAKRGDVIWHEEIDSEKTKNSLEAFIASLKVTPLKAEGPLLFYTLKMQGASG